MQELTSKTSRKPSDCITDISVSRTLAFLQEMWACILRGLPCMATPSQLTHLQATQYSLHMFCDRTAQLTSLLLLQFSTTSPDFIVLFTPLQKLHSSTYTVSIESSVSHHRFISNLQWYLVMPTCLKKQQNLNFILALCPPVVMLCLTHTWIKKAHLSGWCCAVRVALRRAGWVFPDKVSFSITEWWSVKTKSVHLNRGNSNKSYFGEKKTYKKKTSQLSKCPTNI